MPSSTGKGGWHPLPAHRPVGTGDTRAGAALGVTAQPSPAGSPPFCCRRNLVSVKQTYQYPDTQPGDEDAFSREPFVVWFRSPKTGEMLSATRHPSITVPTPQQPRLQGWDRCQQHGTSPWPQPGLSRWSRAGDAAIPQQTPSDAHPKLFLL